MITEFTLLYRVNGQDRQKVYKNMYTACLAWYYANKKYNNVLLASGEGLYLKCEYILACLEDYMLED